MPSNNTIYTVKDKQGNIYYQGAVESLAYEALLENPYTAMETREHETTVGVMFA